MHYTLGQAAKATGKSKATLSRDLKNGKISSSKLEDGSYHIDASELHRVYPPVSQETGQGTGHVTDKEHQKNTFETGGLAAEVERLREQLQSTTTERERERQQLTSQIEDLRRRLDDEGAERRKLTAILTHERTPEQTITMPGTAPTTEQSQAARGWIGRIFGRR